MLSPPLLLSTRVRVSIESAGGEALLCKYLRAGVGIYPYRKGIYIYCEGLDPLACVADLLGPALGPVRGSRVGPGVGVVILPE